MSSFIYMRANKKQNAFTLAETLITLVIVGVVAALTVPSLIIKYQKEQTVTRLKKTYSTLSQTITKAIADNGPITNWEVGNNLDPNAAINLINKYMLPYMSVQGKPTTAAIGHWNGTVYNLNNSKITLGNEHVRFYLNDGTSVTAKFQNYGTQEQRLICEIDINGDKKPNKFGRDIFQFSYWISSSDKQLIGKFVPTSIHKTREDLINSTVYSCRKDLYGYTCGALIMKDDWQIKDDYPW